MGIYGADVCERCLTTHPLDSGGKRPCPKPPIQESESDKVPAVIFKGTGYYTTDSRKITCHQDIM